MKNIKREIMSCEQILPKMFDQSLNSLKSSILRVNSCHLK